MKKRYSLSLLLLIPAVAMGSGKQPGTDSTSSTASTTSTSSDPTEDTYEAWMAKSKEGRYKVKEAGLAALGVAEDAKPGSKPQQTKNAKIFLELCQNAEKEEGDVNPDQAIRKAAYAVNLGRCNKSLCIAKANLAGAKELVALLGSLKDIDGPSGGKAALNQNKLREQTDSLNTMQTEVQKAIEDIEGEINNLNMYGESIPAATAFQYAKRAEDAEKKGVKKAFSLAGFGVDDNHIAAVCKALAKYEFIQELDLGSNVNFTNEGLKAVAELLGDENKRFTRIDIDDSGVNKAGFLAHLKPRLETNKAKLSIYAVNSKDKTKQMNTALNAEMAEVLSDATVTLLDKKK